MRRIFSDVLLIGLVLAFNGCQNPDAPPSSFNPVNFTTHVETITSYTELNQAIGTSKGDYLLVGWTYCCGINTQQLVLYNLDEDGNMIWKKYKEVKDYLYPVGLSICEISNDKFLVLTTMRNADNTVSELGVFQMDNEDNISLINVHEVVGNPFWGRIMPDGNGGYYLIYFLTEVSSDNPNETQSKWEHYDADHNLQGSTTVEGLDGLVDVGRMSSGDFLLTGSLQYEPAAVRLSTNGTETWKAHYSSDQFDTGTSIIESEDGGILLSGISSSLNIITFYDLDADGTLLDRKVLTDSLLLFNNELHKTSNGYLLVNMPGYATAEGIRLMKIDFNFNRMWSTTLVEPAVNNQVLNSVANSDGTFAFIVLEGQSLEFIKTKALE